MDKYRAHKRVIDFSKEKAKQDAHMRRRRQRRRLILVLLAVLVAVLLFLLLQQLREVTQQRGFWESFS